MEKIYKIVCIVMMLVIATISFCGCITEETNSEKAIRIGEIYLYKKMPELKNDENRGIGAYPYNEDGSTYVVFINVSKYEIGYGMCHIDMLGEYGYNFRGRYGSKTYQSDIIDG